MGVQSRSGHVTSITVSSIVAALVAGCVTPALIEDSVSVADLSTAGNGILFVRATLDGLPCAVGNIIVARDRGGALVEPKIYTITIGAKATDALQLVLPAGAYHVGYYRCLKGGKTYEVGEQDGAIVLANPKYSLARFDSVAGEVRSIGQLDFVSDAQTRTARVEVRDLDPYTLDKLKEQAPKLARQIRVAPAVPSGHQPIKVAVTDIEPQGPRTIYVPAYRR